MNNLISTTGPGDSDLFDTIADAIEAQGYIVLPSALPMALNDALYLHLKGLDTEAFKQAAIGREQETTNNPFVRSDRILWIEESAPAVQAYLEWAEGLRLAMNRRLFLGLFDYECHFAYYPPGSFYKTHLDAFQGQRNRVLTTVYYLNPNWQPSDGGQLLLYAPGGVELLETIQPAFGQMVVFLSERFPHEVVPAAREETVERSVKRATAPIGLPPASVNRDVLTPRSVFVAGSTSSWRHSDFSSRSDLNTMSANAEPIHCTLFPRTSEALTPSICSAALLKTRRLPSESVANSPEFTP